MSARDAWYHRFALPGDPTRVVIRRCLAFIVDALVVVLAILAVARITPGSVEIDGDCPTPVPKGDACFQWKQDAYLIDGRDALVYFVVLVVVLTLVLVVLRRVLGTTLGKWLFQIRVVDALGRAPGRGRAFLRTIALAADLITVVIPIGLWLALLTPGHRRIGDLVARTWVVRAEATGVPPTSRGMAPPHPDPDDGT